MAGLCKDCKFWVETLDSKRFSESDGVDVCSCERAALEIGEYNDKGTTSFAWNEDGFSAELFTLGEFGCVQFEQK